MACTFGLGRYRPFLSPFLLPDPRDISDASTRMTLLSQKQLDGWIGSAVTRMNPNDKTKLTVDNQLNCYLFMDTEYWIYVFIADESVRTEDGFSFLVEMRRKIRSVKSQAGVDYMARFKEIKSAGWMEILPVTRPRGASVEKLNYTVTNNNTASKVLPDEIPKELESSGDSCMAQDGVAWRGAFGEWKYRLLADTTLTIPFGKHEHFSRFARILLFFHALVANYFLCVVIALGLEQHNADLPPTTSPDVSPTPNIHIVNTTMEDNFLIIAVITGGIVFLYMQLLKWLMIENLKWNESRDGFYKDLCGYFERFGHYPIALLYVYWIISSIFSSCLLFALGMTCLAFYSLLFDGASLFVISTLCFIVAFLIVICGSRCPCNSISCGWHSCKRYISIWACWECCRWTPDSALGLYLKEHLPMFAPEESEEVGDVQCCLLSLPCCRCISTKCCDECCPEDTPSDKVLLWVAIILSSLAFISGCALIYSTSNLYATMVYVLNQLGYSHLIFIITEVAWTIVSVLLSCILRCLYDIFLECSTKEGNEKPLLSEKV